MQFNYYFLKWLCIALEKQIKEKSIEDIFTQSKNELVFSFRNINEAFHIKASLDGELSMLSFPASFARARKNSADIFQKIQDQTVVSIKQYVNERSFSIQLTNDFDLLFKLHGRRANIILFQSGKGVDSFKKALEQDLKIDLNSLDRQIDQSDTALTNNEFSLSDAYPT